MKKLILLFALLTCLNNYSQCDENIKIPFVDGTFGYYKGCLNDENRPNGFGVLITDSYRQEGIWFEGRLNDPKGKTTYFKNNEVYEGLYKNGVLSKGKYIQKNEDISIEYTGDFNGVVFQGNGRLESISANGKTIKNGEWFNDALYKGTEKTTYNSGLVTIKTYELGKLIKVIRNDRNYYDPDDIVSDSKRSVINLKKQGSENELISYKVVMDISGIRGEWTFDTGAQLTSIGQRMFNRFVKEGIKYKDLNREIKTFGVGGESQGKLVVLDNIKIGDYILNNFIVKVALDNNYSLLGTDFLNKFTNVEWNMKKNELSLVK
jgi:hypothetical protein